MTALLGSIGSVWIESSNHALGLDTRDDADDEVEDGRLRKNRVVVVPQTDVAPTIRAGDVGNELFVDDFFRNTHFSRPALEGLFGGKTVGQLESQSGKPLTTQGHTTPSPSSRTAA